MIIALINWRILPDQVDAFIEKWKTGLTLSGAPGLIGEYLSKVEDSSFHEGVTWEMEADERDDAAQWRSLTYLSFVNVGIWESVDDFMAAVGKYMVKGRTLKESFEAAPRRRAIITPEHWRVGSSSMPSDTSPGVEP
jgi:Antibiotic biosynthesis monooxygenase